MSKMKTCLVALLFVLPSCWWPLCASGQTTHPQEVLALQQVRRKLKDPRNNLWNWKKKTDPCFPLWNGVRCSLNITDGYYHVIELRLLNYNLSGVLPPELGQLPYLEILDFMWNNISGSIPEQIGNITMLRHLLLSGNQISGSLPDKLGDLQNLVKFQLDRNYISGPIPISFAKLPQVKHFHMNNNSISGPIPRELYMLPQLQHFLLDNNNLSGNLPHELSQMQNLKILQLDNNNFQGTEIPSSYGNMSNLLKLSLRNCNLSGTVPDLSAIPGLLYLDLNGNKLMGNIPPNRLSENITTIDLANNQLNGSIPVNFSGFRHLQKLSLSNNFLSGSVPTTIWNNRSFDPEERLILDFQNNKLSDISGILQPPSNVTVKLYGNPVCAIANGQSLSSFCESDHGNAEIPGGLNKTASTCRPQSCPITDFFEYVPALPDDCFCALPFGVGLLLRSPSISDFVPYRPRFENYIAGNVHVNLSQVDIDSIAWEKRRLRMFLKIFPPYTNGSHTFSNDEIIRITNLFANFSFTPDEIFGPYDLLYFTLNGRYSDVLIVHIKGGISKGVLAGVVLASIFCAIGILLAILLVFWKKHLRKQATVQKDKSFSRVPMKIEGVKSFSFEELEMATKSFSSTSQVGQGGYGKVYKGILANDMVVAIKRAQQGSLQGEKEFYTEIELLSRLHHRNLVSLVGYCDEKDEQMLVYEFMPKGSIHDLLSARYRDLEFGRRLHIALGAARGILYLHTEADPPIIHRDIKANNILLDSKYTAKVSDFGISKLAPLPDEKGFTASHVSTVVKGTPGYLDPEYFLTHKLTEKSDVYSLGIVFLELLTGMQPISHGRNIVREVKGAFECGMIFSIIDGSMGPYPSECVKKWMALALRCSEDETTNRPSMLEVVRELEKVSSECELEVVLVLKAEETDQGCSSTPGMSTSSPPASMLADTYPRRRTNYLSSVDLPGSDLVSGVIPTIKPR